MKKLLVVDDEESVRKLIQLSFQKEYGIFHATNGVEALKSIAENAPDLVITDMNMPDKDGIELIQAIRKAGHKLPIIAFSGSPIANDLLRAGKFLGANEVIRKPFTLVELKEALQRALQ